MPYVPYDRLDMLECMSEREVTGRQRSKDEVDCLMDLARTKFRELLQERLISRPDSLSLSLSDFALSPFLPVSLQPPSNKCPDARAQRSGAQAWRVHTCAGKHLAASGRHTTDPRQIRPRDAPPHAVFARSPQPRGNNLCSSRRCLTRLLQCGTERVLLVHVARRDAALRARDRPGGRAGSPPAQVRDFSPASSPSRSMRRYTVVFSDPAYHYHFSA